MSIYKDESLKRYTDDLSARMPAPGGGSAASLNACLGASLISMVVNFTLGKPKYARYEKELKEILTASEKLREQFLQMVDLDVEAYRSKNIRDSLHVVFMLARLCFEGVKLCPPLINKGNRNLISDVACAVILLEGALASAYFNVEINLKTLNDNKLSGKIRKELSVKLKKAKAIRHKTEEKIGKIIRG